MFDKFKTSEREKALEAELNEEKDQRIIAENASRFHYGKVINLSKEKSQLEKIVQSLKEELQHKHDELQIKKAECTSLERTHDVLYYEYNELKNKTGILYDLNADYVIVESPEKYIKQQQKTFDQALEMQAKTYQEQLSELRKENDYLKKQNAEFVEQGYLAVKKGRRLEAERERFHELYRQLLKKYNDLNSKHEELKENRRELADDNESLREYIDDLEQDLEKYDYSTSAIPPLAVIFSMRKTMNEQTKEITSIREELKDAYSKLSNFENERVATKKKLGNQRKELKIKAEKIEELKKQNENFRTQLKRRANTWGGFY